MHAPQGAKPDVARAPCAGQNVGIKQVSDRIWLVTFIDYDLGYFDDETCRLEPIDNPFGPKVLPMSPVSNVTYVSGTDRFHLARRTE